MEFFPLNKCSISSYDNLAFILVLNIPSYIHIYIYIYKYISYFISDNSDLFAHTVRRQLIVTMHGLSER